MVSLFSHNLHLAGSALHRYSLPVAGLLANQEVIIHATKDIPKRNNNDMGGEEGQTEEEERQKLSKYNIHGEQENHTPSPQNNMQCPGHVLYPAGPRHRRAVTPSPQNNMQYSGHVLNTQTTELCPFSQVLKRLLKLEGEACDIFQVILFCLISLSRPRNENSDILQIPLKLSQYLGTQD